MAWYTFITSWVSLWAGVEALNLVFWLTAQTTPHAADAVVLIGNFGAVIGILIWLVIGKATVHN